MLVLSMCLFRKVFYSDLNYRAEWLLTHAVDAFAGLKWNMTPDPSLLLGWLSPCDRLFHRSRFDTYLVWRATNIIAKDTLAKHAVLERH